MRDRWTLRNLKGLAALAFFVLMLCFMHTDVHAEAELKEGVYTISAYRDPSVVMEAAGGKTPNGTNIQLGKRVYAKHQQFYVSHLGGGRYKLRNLASGRVLDVQGGSKKCFANIQLYDWNGTAAQIFNIKTMTEQGKTVCELIGTGSGLAVDYAGASTKAGTNVRLYTRNHTAGQKWIFTPVPGAPAGMDARISEGFYKIYSSKSESLLVGIPKGLSAGGLSAAMCSADTEDGTIFHIVPTGGGRYRIKVMSSGLSFSIRGTAAQTGTQIVQRAPSGKLCDEWYIRKDRADSEQFTFVCADNYSIVMDLSGGKAEEGRAVRCYASNGSAAQKWRLQAAYDPENAHILPDGIYSISSALKSSRVMEVSGSRLNRNANVALGEKNKFQLNQLFRIRAVGTTGNIYTISNVWSEMVLDVAGNKKANGTNLAQYTENGTSAQLFRIIRVKGGADPVYKIIGKNSGNAVDVAGGKKSPGTNIQMYSYNATNAQLWHFSELTAQDRAAALLTNKKDSTACARNTMLLQEAVDLTSDAGGGTLQLPGGTFYFGSAGYYGRADAAIICRDNVTIEGAGMDSTILKPYGTFKNGMNMFYYGGAEYVTNADFRNFTIDSAEEKTLAYNNQGKGFMLSPIKDCDWENVKVRNTDGTGFGVDLPVNCTIRDCIAEKCGKAASRNSNGASGFGIGIGLSNDESMIIENCHAYGNTKFGFFFENQVIFKDTREKCRASEAAGFLVKNCTAGDNLYDFGGNRAHDLTYENCRSMRVSDSALRALNRGVYFQNHSRRINVTGCSIEERFKDVTDSSAECYEPIYWAYNRGIVERASSGSEAVFEPEDNLTRGMAAELLYRYAGRPGDVVQYTTAEANRELTVSFTDILPYTDCYDAVEWLNQQGFADVFTETEQFGAKEPVTGGAYLNLLYRFAGSPAVVEEEILKTEAVRESVSGNSVSGNTVSGNSILDESEPAEKLAAAKKPPVFVRWALQNGIIGEEAEVFDENMPLSRGEAVTWLYRYSCLEY